MDLIFTLIAAMSLVGGGRGLLDSGLVAAGGSPGTNLHRQQNNLYRYCYKLVNTTLY